MVVYGGGAGRTRGVGGCAQGVGGRARAWCLRACVMSSGFVLHEVADRFGDLGVGLSGLDWVGTAPGKHEEYCGIARPSMLLDDDLT